MFGNKASGIVTFYYDREKLFNDVGLLSAYMTKNLATEAGSVSDAFSITEDERDAFDVCVSQALPAIYDSMIKLTSDIDKAFAEVDIETDETAGLERKVGRYIEFNLNDNVSYNENVRTLIDASLYDCIKHGVLNEFYSINVNRELYKIANDKFAASLYNLNKRLFQLKRKPVSSQIR